MIRPHIALEKKHYHYSGLHISSELAIPEWAPFEQNRLLTAPDVVISLNPAENEPLPEGEIVPAVDSERYRFHVPGTADYLVQRGRMIAITPAPGAQARELRLFLLGTAWGALCYQRGLLILHAAVVQVGKNCIAFCGATGSGKSTAAAWLIARGHRLVADDLCRFETPANGPPLVYPAAPRLKLWRDAVAKLGSNPTGLERDHFRNDKFHLPMKADQARRRRPLAAIFLLEWGVPGLARLTGATALRRVVAAATYRGDLLEPMGQVAAHWEKGAALLRRAPVWEFQRPKDWSAMDAAMNLLLTKIISVHYVQRRGWPGQWKKGNSGGSMLAGCREKSQRHPNRT